MYVFQQKKQTHKFSKKHKLDYFNEIIYFKAKKPKYNNF